MNGLQTKSDCFFDNGPQYNGTSDNLRATIWWQTAESPQEYLDIITTGPNQEYWMRKITCTYRICNTGIYPVYVEAYTLWCRRDLDATENPVSEVSVGSVYSPTLPFQSCTTSDAFLKSFLIMKRRLKLLKPQQVLTVRTVRKKWSGPVTQAVEGDNKFTLRRGSKCMLFRAWGGICSGPNTTSTYWGCSLSPVQLGCVQQNQFQYYQIGVVNPASTAVTSIPIAPPTGMNTWRNPCYAVGVVVNPRSNATVGQYPQAVIDGAP